MLTNNYFAFLLVFCLSFTAAGQQASINGTYLRAHKVNESGDISYRLTLKSDFTYQFEFSRQITSKNPREHANSQGTWKQLDKTRIELTTNKDIIDLKDVLDLTGSKAHFISKNPRDKSDREIPTALKIYDSPVSWIKGLDLIKQ